MKLKQTSRTSDSFLLSTSCRSSHALALSPLLSCTSIRQTDHQIQGRRRSLRGLPGVECSAQPLCANACPVMSSGAAWQIARSTTEILLYLIFQREMTTSPSNFDNFLYSAKFHTYNASTQPFFKLLLSIKRWSAFLAYVIIMTYKNKQSFDYPEVYCMPALVNILCEQIPVAT